MPRNSWISGAIDSLHLQAERLVPDGAMRISAHRIAGFTIAMSPGLAQVRARRSEGLHDTRELRTRTGVRPA